MLSLLRRIEDLERTLHPRTGRCHLLFVLDDEEVDRKVAEVREQDPNPKAILVIIGLHAKENT